jgi:RNA polymerase sigma-70 factor (ECF subfamily)
MRRRRVLGNESALIPVILTVTPARNLDMTTFARPGPGSLRLGDRPPAPRDAPANGLKGPRRDALRSAAKYPMTAADLYMKDHAGGNLDSVRFQALCQSLRPDLVRFAFWLSRDRALAEDVVQETLLRAWKARASLKDEAAAKPWFLTIIRREYARTFERKRLVTVDVDELIAREEPMLAASQDQELAELRAALFKLPEEFREPLVMQVLMGSTTAEIAAELNLSPAAVLTRLFRGRKQLRALCGEDTSGDPE